MNQIGVEKTVPATSGHPAHIPEGMPVNFTGRPAGAALRIALLGVTDTELAQRLAQDVRRFTSDACVMIVSNLVELHELAANSAPYVIFLDSDLLRGESLFEPLQRLAAIAPVLVLASVNSQAEVAKLVGGGNVEFIGRMGDFIPLAVALIERRLNWARVLQPVLELNGPNLPADMGEVFRHEINNPLTGILGNAELVLAHREHLSPVEVQRLQTVVDLAVRLRESIRRISNACEQNSAPAKSA